MINKQQQIYFRLKESNRMLHTQEGYALQGKEHIEMKIEGKSRKKKTIKKKHKWTVAWKLHMMTIEILHMDFYWFVALKKKNNEKAKPKNWHERKYFRKAEENLRLHERGLACFLLDMLLEAWLKTWWSGAGHHRRCHLHLPYSHLLLLLLLLHGHLPPTPSPTLYGGSYFCYCCSCCFWRFLVLTFSFILFIYLSGAFVGLIFHHFHQS